MSLSDLLGKLLGKPSVEQEAAKAKPKASSKAPHKKFVLVRALVSHKGEVKQVKVRISCGDKALDEKACQEILMMPFAPGHTGNRKQDQWHNLRYDIK